MLQMNKQELLTTLVLSEQRIGLVQTLHCFYGANIKVSIGYTNSACNTGIDELCFSVRIQIYLSAVPGLHELPRIL